MAQLDNVQVNVGLPMVGSITGTWRPDDASRRAAHHMFVEVVTRGVLIPAGDDGLSMREFLESVHSLLITSRAVLHEAGPDVWKAARRNELSFGSLTLQVTNKAIMPMLAKWDRRLEEYEAKRPEGRSKRAYEESWDRADEFKEHAQELRETLIEFADMLAIANDIPPLSQQLEASSSKGRSQGALRGRSSDAHGELTL